MMTTGHIIGATTACVVCFWLFGNPDAGFRSSDGIWRDGEVSFKGRNFETVVILFEAYKIKCAVEEKTLLRTTPMRWYNIFAWPSYRSEKKWRVPYADSTHVPTDQDHCVNDGWPPGLYETVKVRAEEYINRL